MWANKAPRKSTLDDRLALEQRRKLQWSANQAQSQLQASQQEAELYDAVQNANRAIAQSNARVVAVLHAATGLDLGDDPNKWWEWWLSDYNELGPSAASGNDPNQSKRGKPEYLFNVVPVEMGTSCFAPETKVWTQLGRSPIKKIKVGDRVLSQNVETGELAYKPVLGVTLRPPHPRIKIDAGKESIAATPGHPFWVDGKAWQLAKQLEAGQLLHSLSGGVPVASAEKSSPILPGKAVPTT